MKIIELLNKIANSEEVPNKIKYIDEILIYDTKINNYRHDEAIEFYTDKFIIDIGLNDEVEIIEEEQDIEHYDYCDNPDVMTPSVIANNFQRLNEDLDIIVKAVNELKKNER